MNLSINIILLLYVVVVKGKVKGNPSLDLYVCTLKGYSLTPQNEHIHGFRGFMDFRVPSNFGDACVLRSGVKC